MKKQFVENLVEGDTVSDYFVATRKDLRSQQSGSKFLGMVFKDRTGEIGGIMWNNAAAIAKLFEVGDVVRVRGVVTSYQSRLQVRAEQVLPLKESEFDWGDLVFEPEDSHAVLEAFRALLGTIQEPALKALVDAFLDDEAFMARFTAAAAGKKWHHAFRGGLVRHCYEMARIAERVCEIFPDVNRDLLLTAVFLHDIGKIDEMTHDLFVDYTTEGKLLGHLVMGTKMVEERITAIPEFPEVLRLELLHCILAHHGELVNGSPVVPKTAEAMILFQCDNLDAQTDALLRIAAETKDRGARWSDYIALIDRQVWTKEL